MIYAQSSTTLVCVYTQYSDASIFIMYAFFKNFIMHNWELHLFTVEVEGPRGSAESGKETCLLFQVYLRAIVVFFLGWLLILKVVLSQPSKLFLCSVLLAGVLSCRSCVEQRPKLNPQIWCPNFGIRFQELFFLISKVPKEVVRI